MADYLREVLRANISKCMVTVEVTLRRRENLGAVCLHLPEYLQMAGQQRTTERKGKLFSGLDSWGKEKANDIDDVDCYLPSGIAPISGSECVCVLEW